jgi:hypothetical protein
MNGTPTVTAVKAAMVMDNPGVVTTGVLVRMRAVPAQLVQPIPAQVLGLLPFMKRTPDRVALNVMNHIYSKSYILIK